MERDTRFSNGSVMKFDKDISKLSDVDLPRYKDFFLDKILGDQPEAHHEKLFRSRVLDRVEKINIEIIRRHNGSE